jgi:glucose/arabinose dehydrogenase
MRRGSRGVHVERVESRLLFASVLPGFADSLVVDGLERAVAMDFAPDGRIFVTEQSGRVRVVKDGQLLPTPFVTLPVDPNGERGALGVALDPAFAQNGFVYVYYTATSPTTHNRVSRFVAAGDVAAAGSETVILDLETLSNATNHNGGAIHFGPDGKLYVAQGENGNATHSQTLENRFGKILRINPDGSIPSDNPFFTTAAGEDRSIWALGLRNPFTFAFHRTSGRMLINDVGGGAFEEVNEGTAGANYGWPEEEGPSTAQQFVPPLFAYTRNEGSQPRGSVITGGTFYDAAVPQFPAQYADDYFFADLSGGWIWSLDAQTGQATEFATEIDPAVDLKVGPDGSLYYLAYTQGEIHRISFAADPGAPPAILTQPSAASVPVGQPATFTVDASGDALTYQWQRDGVDIPGATAASFTLPAVAAGDDGAQFRVVVSNANGSVTSNPAALDAIQNGVPTAVITSPAEGRLYTAGQRVRFKGAGTDPEDGKLRNGAFSWRVDFHHADHVHPFLPEAPGGGPAGSFRVPRDGETSADVWYRIHLTVTDSAGLTATTFRDVHPRTATIIVNASHPGLDARIDGQPTPTPASFEAVVGMRRTLGADASQVVDGVGYTFRRWSGRRVADLAFTVPARDRTFTATYQPIA